MGRIIPGLFVVETAVGSVRLDSCVTKQIKYDFLCYSIWEHSVSDERAEITERVQRMVAAVVATHPAGAGLCLVGGFRYRLLDRGPRRSVDIDYHWEGDLAAKQRELISLFERRLLPDVRRQCGLEGSATAARGVGADSAAVAVVELAFWRLGSTLGRIEIPVDVTRIECVDPPIAKTADGIVYRTASNADMLESKVMAILGRTFIEHRDMLDLHLFASHSAADATTRIRGKCARVGLHETAIRRRFDDLVQSADRHARAIDALIREQCDATMAAVLADSGGGMAVLESVRRRLAELLGASGANTP